MGVEPSIDAEALAEAEIDSGPSLYAILAGLPAVASVQGIFADSDVSAIRGTLIVERRSPSDLPAPTAGRAQINSPEELRTTPLR
jgi:hypothetical protein